MNNQSRVADSVGRAERAHQSIMGMGLGDIRISVLLRLNYGLMTDALNDMLAPFQLTHVSYIALMMINGSATGSANPSELCIGTGETRANMTRITDDLAAKGLIRRVTSLEDRRRVDLSLTAEGMKVLRQVVPLLHERHKVLMGDFSAEEKTQLISMLARLNDTLEAQG